VSTLGGLLDGDAKPVLPTGASQSTPPPTAQVDEALGDWDAACVLVRLTVALSSGLALMPGVCAASTVSLADRSPIDYGSGWASIAYRASPGEANHVLLTTVDQLTVRVTDPNAVITVGRACRSLDAHTAECSVAGMGQNGLIGAQVEAGDLNDVVDSQGPGLSADGGPGDDLLESSSIAAGILNGGGGRDTLLGGTNQDTLIDGDASSAADSDTLDGRDGGAIVSYAARTARVLVDLDDPGGDGEVGEGDVLRSITGAIGGRGADVLRGDRGTNSLDGGPGNDRLSGLGGDDLLAGGSGDDRVAGLAGDDFIQGQAGRDALNGGKGRDFVDGGAGQDALRGDAGPDFLRSGSAHCGDGLDEVQPAARDYVAGDCEAARFGLGVTRREFADSKQIALDPYPVAVDRSTVTFKLECPYLDLDGESKPVTLQGTVTLRTGGGTLLGSAHLPDPCSDEGFSSKVPTLKVRVPLSSAGQRLLLGRTRIVTVAFAGRNVPPVPWRIRLRGPRAM
jgi:Ca2+-binding RTX toxin-like protein